MLECKCGWHGNESECDVIVDMEPYEFWGVRGTQRVEETVCPECGNEDLYEVEEAEEVE